jgi:hypothetical protein
MTGGRGYDDVVVSEPGGVNAHRLPVAAPQASWELNGSGAFSAFIRQDDLRSAGLDIDLKGMWVEYASSAGAWGGVITGRPTTNNVVEIAAEGYASLLRGHVLDSEGNFTVGATAGGLAQRAIVLAGTGNPTFITIGMIDHGGAPVSVDLSGDVGTDILPQIASAALVEWIVDANRVFTLARRLGRDRSADVRLVEDRHIARHRVNDDIWSMSDAPVYSEVPGVALVSGESAPAAWLGQRPGIGAHNPAVPNDPRAPIHTVSIELTLVNRDDCFQTFDLGDTVRVDIGSIGLCGRFRGVTKGLDGASHALTIAGELLRDD